MKKFFIGLMCLVTIVAVSLVVINYPYLIFLPGSKSIAIEQPLFAFAFEDGYAVIDNNGSRILYCDKSLILQWMHTRSEILGTIKAAAANLETHELFLIDSITIEDIQYERLIRFDVYTGKPLETIAQYKPADKRNFVPRSLTVAQNALYYLDRDSDDIVYLKKRVLPSGEEKGLFRTKWNIENAELAIIGSKIFIKSEGNILLYSSGILQSLPEINKTVRYCSAIASGAEDTLLIADASSGSVFRYLSNGKLEHFVRATEVLSALPPLPEDPGMMAVEFIDKEFSLAWDTSLSFISGVSAISYSGRAYLFIDNLNNKIAIASTSVPDTCIQGILLSSTTIQKTMLAWSALAIALVLTTALLFIFLFYLHSVKNNLLTYIAAFIPSMLIILAVLVLIFFYAERTALLKQQKEIQKQAMRAAQTGASRTDGDKLLKFTANSSTLNVQEFKTILAKTASENSPDILLTICAPGTIYPLVVTDNTNFYSQYQPVRFIPGKSYAELLKLNATTFNIKVGNILHIYALAPIMDSSSNFAGFISAKISILTPSAKTILQYTIDRYYIYLIILGCGFFLISVLFYLFSNKAHERAHITSYRKTDKVTENIESASEPVLEDEDFDIPVIPDIKFDNGSSFNPANIFSIEELPPMEDIDLPQVQNNNISDSHASAAENLQNLQAIQKNKPTLSPEGSFFARASTFQKTEPYGAAHQKPVVKQEEHQASSPITAQQTLDTQFASNNVFELHKDAVTALKSGNYQLAVTLLERVIQLTPQDTKALNNLAVAYKRTGNNDKAISCLERAIELNPSDIAAKKNLDILRNSH